ncbi:hypothetical protein BpHYR1_006483 [Brachionus plicatilis]|uniref:Uncharacterized protein n=1 Tax=Brachionus plicatilis TaxID=10195 RepID=A0A3M7RHU1_BRAPC|nr:hypothetical protein BpHYR1_006483 [Brachionus plicatilis]
MFFYKHTNTLFVKKNPMINKGGVMTTVQRHPTVHYDSEQLKLMLKQVQFLCANILTKRSLFDSFLVFKFPSSLDVIPYDNKCSTKMFGMCVYKVCILASCLEAHWSHMYLEFSFK